MRRNQDLPRGRIERLEIESEALRGNLQGDPNRRELHVYLPPGRADGAGLPLLVDMVGFTGSGMSHTNWRNFGENVPERLDRLIGEGAMGPVAVAFPEAQWHEQARCVTVERPDSRLVIYSPTWSGLQPV